MSIRPIEEYQVRVLEPKTLAWWRSREDQIDMDPSYQRRGRLWSESDKAYLIDSILNGFDVPKFYIADFTWGASALNKARLPYAIIDGKQRFEAIFDFYRGDLVLQRDFELAANPRLKLGGLGYRDLVRNHSDVAELLDQYHIHVMGVYTKSEDPINELFVRLNRSKPLTGAEIRNAMTGPAPEIIRQVASHEFFTDIVKFSVKRAEDLNAAAKLLVFEYYDGPRETKKRNLDDFALNAGNNKGGLELAARKVLDGLDALASVFLPRDALLGSAGIVPVYYGLVRASSESDLSKLRAFLVDFEDRRLKNRAIVREEPKSPDVDQELVEYDNYNRSTNDQSSHIGRFRILQDRFKR